MSSTDNATQLVNELADLYKSAVDSIMVADSAACNTFDLLTLMEKHLRTLYEENVSAYIIYKAAFIGASDADFAAIETAYKNMNIEYKKLVFIYKNLVALYNSFVTSHTQFEKMESFDNIYIDQEPRYTADDWMLPM
jgi:hypothetical protein